MCRYVVAASVEPPPAAPRPPRSLSTMPLTTSDAVHFFVEGAAGNRLHGLDFGGEGPTLVCLHGVTGNAWNWYAVALGVRAHRRVVALDFRGYGESQWSPSHDSPLRHVDLAGAAQRCPAAARGPRGILWGALVALRTRRASRRSRTVAWSVEPSLSRRDSCSPPRDHADHMRSGRVERHLSQRPRRHGEGWRPCYGAVDAGRLAPSTIRTSSSAGRSLDDHWDRLPRSRRRPSRPPLRSLSGPRYGRDGPAHTDIELVEIADSTMSCR